MTIVVTSTGPLPYLYAREEQASGTNGGGSAAAAYQTRTLNTVKTNTITGASLSSNQVPLPAGTYYFRAVGPSFRVVGSRSKLYNVTDSADVLTGSTQNTSASLNVMNPVCGQFTITATKTIDLRTYTGSAVATNGLGIAAATGDVEVYSELEIWKLS